MEMVLQKLLEQAVQLPNSRSLGLSRASWTKDADEESIPELRLNVVLLGEAFVLLLAKGLGTLALLWATVVLLGGFSTMLAKTDFWFTTAIIFIETAGVVGFNTQPASKFVIDVPAAFAELGNFGVKRPTDFVGLVIMAPVFVTAAPIFAAAGCITLSIMRLVAVTRHNYGNSNADSSKENLKPALILFYALVLTQGALFVVWLALTSSRQDLVVKAKDQLELEDSELIERYIMTIVDTCIDRGVSSTITRNFVSFAADLLQSEHSADHVSAVTLLHALVLQEKRAARALDQIRSSQQFVDRLVQMLGPRSSLNGKPKEYTAEIIAKLASHLRLAEMPGSTRIISSLLDPTLINIRTQINQVPEHRPRWVRPDIRTRTNGFKKEPRCVDGSVNNINRCKKPLIVHGLLILAELASDPDNCSEISNTTGLVAKITTPITHGLHTATGNDDDTSIQIVKASLAVVANIVSGRGKTSGDVAQEIVTSDSRTGDNIIWILKNSSDAEMKIAAIQILANLTFDELKIHQFIPVLRHLLFDPTESSLGLAAEQALAALLLKDQRNCKMVLGEKVGTEYPVIQQLVTVMRCEENPEEYRAAAAELLAQICANSTTEDVNLLAQIGNTLSTALKAIVDTESRMQLLVPQNPQDHEESSPVRTSPINVVIQVLLDECSGNRKDVQNQPSSRIDYDRDAELLRRKLLGSLLRLTLHTDNKLIITAKHFDAAVAGIPLQMDGFVKMLKGIVQKTSQYPDEVDSLVIIKDTSELAVWMMQQNHSYILYFRQEDIVGELKKAAEAMAALERYMILSGGAHEATRSYKTLSALVGEVEALIPQVH